MHESTPISYLEKMPRDRKGYVDIIFHGFDKSAFFCPAVQGAGPILAYVIPTSAVRIANIDYFGADYLMPINAPEVNIDEFAKELPSWIHERSDTLDGKPIRIYTSKSNYKNKKPSRIVRITNNLVTIENTETPNK